MQKTIAVLMILAIAATGPSRLSAASADTINSFQYLQLLISIRGITEEAIATQSPDIFSDKISGFPKEVIVAMPPQIANRKQVSVSLQWIHQYLNNQSPTGDERNKLNSIEHLRRILFEQEQQLSKTTDLNPDQAKAIEKAKKILAEKIYNFEEKEEEAEMPNDSAKPSRTSGSKDFEIGWNLAILMVVLVIAVLALLRLLKVIDFKTQKKPTVQAIQGGLLQDEDPKDSDQLQEKGKTSFEKGEYATSIRYYYLAFILTLHEQSVLNYNPSFTNWEYYRAIPREKMPEAPVYSVTQLFDESHYGRKSVSEENFKRFMLEIRQCISIAKGGKG